MTAHDDYVWLESTTHCISEWTKDAYNTTRHHYVETVSSIGAYSELSWLEISSSVLFFVSGTNTKINNMPIRHMPAYVRNVPAIPNASDQREPVIMRRDRHVCSYWECQEKLRTQWGLITNWLQLLLQTPALAIPLGRFHSARATSLSTWNIKRKVIVLKGIGRLTHQTSNIQRTDWPI